MYTRPMILPLESTGRIYVLEDEKGQVVGTGSREVCETLMYIIAAGLSPAMDQQRSHNRSGSNNDIAFKPQVGSEVLGLWALQKPKTKDLRP
jgi:hypothetical protein